MKELKDFKQVYFVGAGGIGMSAIGRYFLHLGLEVAGYDKTPSPLTKQLEKEGMKLHYTDDLELVSKQYTNKEETLVVYTPAIPSTHQELTYFRDNGFTVLKRAQVLGELTRSHKGLCVAGTHGKTTTSSMCAHIMHQSHLDCNAFLGGITQNYGTNYIFSESDYVVIEADEYDRSFHWLRPWMTVITSTDPDHLDIYGTEEAYLESFRHYTTLIQPGGALIQHTGLKMKADVPEGVTVYSYGREEGDFHAENIVIANKKITFDFVAPDGRVDNISLGQPVLINIDNAIGAMSMAWLCGCTPEELREGISTFVGVDRRFDIKLEDSRHVVLSDYAHHPMEIKQSALSIKELYKGRKVTALFQPHLYTRTRDFYRQFAESLSILDEVVLCEIYPAREEPIPGVTSKLIYDNLAPHVKREMLQSSEVLDYVRGRDFDVLLILGAGDLDNLTNQITDIIKAK